MKKTLTLLLIISISWIFAINMIIEKTDGSIETVFLDEIDSINFSSTETMIIQTAAGALEFELSEIASISFNEGVSVEEMEMILSKIPFRFLKNSPNPFNPTTKISFELTEITEVAEIMIFNIKGQKIKSYKICDPPVGSIQTVLWNGRDENDKSVSSGVYFYKLQINGKQEAQKMLMLK